MPKLSTVDRIEALERDTAVRFRMIELEIGSIWTEIAQLQAGVNYPQPSNVVNVVDDDRINFLIDSVTEIKNIVKEIQTREDKSPRPWPDVEATKRNKARLAMSLRAFHDALVDPRTPKGS